MQRVVEGERGRSGFSRQLCSGLPGIESVDEKSDSKQEKSKKQPWQETGSKSEDGLHGAELVLSLFQHRLEGQGYWVRRKGGHFSGFIFKLHLKSGDLQIIRAEKLQVIDDTVSGATDSVVLPLQEVQLSILKSLDTRKSNRYVVLISVQDQ